MPYTVQTLTSQSMGISVHCYLLRSGEDFFLVDSGIARQRERLDRDLQAAGCSPGRLKLLLLTHGDSDHAGNAAYLREHFGAKIAMHAADVINVQTGDMFANKQTAPAIKAFTRILLSLTGLGGMPTFTPDILLEDGQDLAPLGLEATVMHLPGHSKGSIAILTAQGDLFCGDLLVNTQKPAVNTLADDLALLKASAARFSFEPN